MGQDVHEVAPAVEYDPAEHDVHPEALNVPPFVTVPAYPGAHIVHEEIDVLPVKEPVV